MNKSIFNINEFRKLVKEYHQISFMNSAMYFYYDETGNCRKFWLRNGTVNSLDAVKNDFIIGGIVFEDESKIDVNKLFNDLHLQSNQKELKLKHFQNKGNDFLSIIDNEKMTIFLDWLINSDLYIHYSALNNMYYALVDIVDTLCDEFPEIVPFYHHKLKAKLNKFALDNFDSFVALLSKYGYPDLQLDQMELFCNELASLIDENMCQDKEMAFYMRTLKDMLKKAGEDKNMPLLEHNTPGVLIDDYTQAYTERCWLFPYSQHTFDEEMQIAEKMQNIQFVFNGRNLDHFKFVKSHTNRYIQISDVIVGLLGKMFSYFDANSLCDIYIKSMRISKQAKENVRKIAKLIDRSDRKSSLLIKNVNSFDVLKDREEKLEILAKK